jgi:hypothetical protein
MEEFINKTEFGKDDHNFAAFAIKTIYHIMEDEELEFAIK